MHRDPGELVPSWDVGDQRPVQEAGRGDDRMCSMLVPLAARFCGHDPLTAVAVPRTADHRGVEANVLVDLVLLGYSVQVLEILGAEGVVVGPAGVQLEGEGVVVVAGGVDGRARIGVYRPGAPSSCRCSKMV
jgi:hypothetical protein